MWPVFSLAPGKKMQNHTVLCKAYLIWLLSLANFSSIRIVWMGEKPVCPRVAGVIVCCCKIAAGSNKTIRE